MKTSIEVWLRCVDWVGLTLNEHQIELLTRYAEWLRDEAIPAGGLGPKEESRITNRHIGDSLLFAKPLANPSEIVDFGSGAGLPGLPISIVFPDSAVHLIDRSGRRIKMLRRALRVLQIPNVRITQGDTGSLPDSCEAILSRATFTPEVASRHFVGHLGEGGVAVIGGSWRTRPVVSGWETVDVPPRILDQPVWLLMMRAQ